MSPASPLADRIELFVLYAVSTGTSTCDLAGEILYATAELDFMKWHEEIPVQKSRQPIWGEEERLREISEIGEFLKQRRTLTGQPLKGLCCCIMESLHSMQKQNPVMKIWLRW